MSASAGVRLAIFDCDGTMVDSQHSIVAAMHAAFDALDVRRPPAQAIRRIVGLPLLEAIALLSPNERPEVHQRLREGYRDAYSASRRRGEIDDPLFPGLIETLDALEADGWILGVATGKSRAGLENTLESHGLLKRFLTLQTADRAPGKPNPDMLLQAMAEAGADKARTVMIGDTTFDMEMARHAGTKSIGVAWGYHDPDELVASDASMITHAYTEIPEAVSNLMELR